nr:MAG TPA_asm: hypothetical protein [Bacteriophage sp.]
MYSDITLDIVRSRDVIWLNVAGLPPSLPGTFHPQLCTIVKSLSKNKLSPSIVIPQYSPIPSYSTEKCVRSLTVRLCSQ